MDSAAIIDDSVGAVDVANSLVHDMDAKTTPVGADTFLINDSEASNINKEVSLTNVANTLAGTQASTGLTDATGVLTVSPADNAITIGADSIVYMTAAGVPKKDLASDVVAAIGGTAATTGLSNASGVLTVAAKIAHFVAGEKSSLFFEAAEVDFGAATAVDTKITDAAAAKGKLILAIAVVTEAFNGDADNVISISSASAGATKMSSDITVDKDADAEGNWIGGVYGAAPVSGANAIVASGGDVYAYSAANTNRSAGKAYIFLVLQKTA